MSASNVRGAVLAAESVKDEGTSLSEETFELLREKAEQLKEKTGSGSIFLTTGYAGSGPGSAHNRRLRNIAISRAKSIQLLTERK